jgi:hypothetical protein
MPLNGVSTLVFSKRSQAYPDLEYLSMAADQDVSKLWVTA